MKTDFWQNLPILRFLSGLWGWLTMLIFTVDFFSSHAYPAGVSAIAVIYGAILALYAGSKEYQRWREKTVYQSRHFGELYVIIWTLLMVIFVSLSPFSQGYFKIPGELPAVYLTVVSVFIISRESRKLRKDKQK